MIPNPSDRGLPETWMVGVSAVAVPAITIEIVFAELRGKLAIGISDGNGTLIDRSF